MNEEELKEFYSEKGWKKFLRENQDQMYDKSEANTYKKWLEYERTFTHMGNNSQLENKIIDEILEKLK